MSNLLTRILTAVIAGSAVVAGIWASEYGLFALCVLIAVAGSLELLKIAGANTLDIQTATVVSILLSSAGMLWKPAFMMYGLLFIYIPLAGILQLFNAKTKDPLRSMAMGGLSLLYIYVPFMLLYQLSIGAMEMETNPLYGGNYSHHPDYDFRIPLGFLFLTWITDSMAYFGGRFLGKHKLFERISPKKTWEGTVIGAISCLGLAFLFQQIWPVHWNWLVVGAIIAIFTQLGDLVESMLKRSLKIKDSGGLLPGHGGVLDRFDGPFITLPILFFYDFCLHVW